MASSVLGCIMTVSASGQLKKYPGTPAQKEQVWCQTETAIFLASSHMFETWLCCKSMYPPSFLQKRKVLFLLLQATKVGFHPKESG